jgi:hypothetical protein
MEAYHRQDSFFMVTGSTDSLHYQTFIDEVIENLRYDLGELKIYATEDTEIHPFSAELIKTQITAFQETLKIVRPKTSEKIVEELQAFLRQKVDPALPDREKILSRLEAQSMARLEVLDLVMETLNRSEALLDYLEETEEGMAALFLEDLMEQAALDPKLFISMEEVGNVVRRIKTAFVARSDN